METAMKKALREALTVIEEFLSTLLGNCVKVPIPGKKCPIENNEMGTVFGVRASARWPTAVVQVHLEYPRGMTVLEIINVFELNCVREANVS